MSDLRVSPSPSQQQQRRQLSSHHHQQPLLRHNKHHTTSHHRRQSPSCDEEGSWESLVASYLSLLPTDNSWDENNATAFDSSYFYLRDDLEPVVAVHAPEPKQATLDNAIFLSALPSPLPLALDTWGHRRRTSSHASMAVAIAAQSAPAGASALALEPGSPPDLTDSRSSKSSSTRNSLSFDDQDAIEELSQFGDVSLEDMQSAHRQGYPPSSGRHEEAATSHNQRQLTRKSWSPKSSPLPQEGLRPFPMRDLTNFNNAHPKPRPGLPSPKSFSASMINEPRPRVPGQHPKVNLPPLRTLRRRSHSPVSAGHPHFAPPESRSRTPSPLSRPPHSAMPSFSPPSPRPQQGPYPSFAPPSPRPPHSAMPSFAPHSPMRPMPRKSNTMPPMGLGLHVRRNSWAPDRPRKSVQELEDECRDSDEEVDEEAVIFNVPLSPSACSISSRTPSPERPPMHSSPGPWGEYRRNGRHTPTHSFSGGPVRPRFHRHSRSSLPSSAVSTTFPSNQMPFYKHRTKSWHNVMDDLSKEARDVTAALELHAEQEDRRNSQINLAPKGETESTMPPPSITSPTSLSNKMGNIMTTTIEIAAANGSVMIDPLPISKEKEKLLSKTRPSWLPPKCPKEEKKHLREFQKMMARSMELDRKRALSGEQARPRSGDLSRSGNEKAWQNCLRVPTWDKSVLEDRGMSGLCWEGIAPSCRGKVWQRAIGNELSLTEKSYNANVYRAGVVEKEVAKLTTPESRAARPEAAWFDAIEQDLAVTYPELNLFHDSSMSLHASLAEVLKAFAFYRADVGYRAGTGINLLAAQLLMTIGSAPCTFVALANIMWRPTSVAFSNGHDDEKTKLREQVTSQMAQTLPKMHAHLASLELDPSMWCDDMLRSFLLKGQTANEATRWLDVIVFEEGPEILIRGALVVCKALEWKVLSASTAAEALDVFSGRWNVGGDGELVRCSRA